MFVKDLPLLVTILVYHTKELLQSTFCKIQWTVKPNLNTFFEFI